MRDYLAMRHAEPNDGKWYGVLGMKWGRRRSEDELANATAARKAAGEEVTPTKKAAAVTVAPGAESASQRYARLSGEAKGGGHSNWSEEDLKFYNARTDAISKVNKMFAENPSWLRSTSETVLRSAAQKQMQSIADGVAKKYISDALLNKLNDTTAAKLAESSTPIDYIGKHRAKKKN